MLGELTELATSRPTVVVLGRYPTEADRGDGYYRRVASIDEILSTRYARIYVRTDGSWQSGAQTIQIREDLFELRLNRRLSWLVTAAVKLAKSAGRVYAHSILILEGAGLRAVYDAAAIRALDLHGAVPEEIAYQGDPNRGKQLEALQLWAIERATCPIGVTQRLLDYLGKQGIVLPTLGAKITVTGGDRPGFALYAGGLQKWQQIDKMLRYVSAHCPEQCAFLTPDPAGIRELYRQLAGQEFPGLVESCPPDQIAQRYSQYGYGLLLREPHILNQVSCPTKLGEYLDAGLAPIVDSPDIGDFAKLGFRYVGFDEPLPTEAERTRIVIQNHQVMAALREQFDASSVELLRRLN